MHDQMTPRERWIAAVRMEPVDRLPFWPKLNGAYPRARTGRFRGMENGEIHDWIGSDKHVGLPGCVTETRVKTSVETTTSGAMMRTVYRTPLGELTSAKRFDEPSQSWHPVEFPVKTASDIPLMAEIYGDVALELDEEGLAAARRRDAQIGQTAVTTDHVGESPLMHWVEWLAGIENAHFLLADHTAEVENLFDAIHKVLVRKTEIICENSPADLIYMTENTSTTLISPAQYERYCAAHIRGYARIARDAGRNMVLHMCGHLKGLLPQLACLPVRAFEAFTSPTLGNTTLLDGRTQCPDKCLIGGTNAMLWTRPSGEIIAQIERDLDALPHHRGIAVTSAGVMPPMCGPETIRTVCRWVKEYAARMD